MGKMPGDAKMDDDDRDGEGSLFSRELMMVIPEDRGNTTGQSAV